MSKSCLPTARKSNENIGPTTPARRTIVRSISAAKRAAHAVWSNKPAAELAGLLGVSVRTAEYILAEKKGLTADGLIKLLTTPETAQHLARELAKGMSNDVLAALRRELKAEQLRRRRAAIDLELEFIEREDD